MKQREVSKLILYLESQTFVVLQSFLGIFLQKMFVFAPTTLPREKQGIVLPDVHDSAVPSKKSTEVERIEKHANTGRELLNY